jgi:hypothetical protein
VESDIDGKGAVGSGPRPEQSVDIHPKWNAEWVSMIFSEKTGSTALFAATSLRGKGDGKLAEILIQCDQYASIPSGRLEDLLVAGVSEPVSLCLSAVYFCIAH